MLTGSVYCGISSTWLRCSCRISLTNSRKRFGASQIQRAAGRAPVPVSAGNERHAAIARPVLATRLFSLRLRVALISNACRNCAAQSKNRSRLVAASLHSHASLRPQWMIEHHQHIRKPIEHGQQFAQTLIVRAPRIRGEIVHDGLRLRRSADYALPDERWFPRTGRSTPAISAYAPSPAPSATTVAASMLSWSVSETRLFSPTVFSI